MKQYISNKTYAEVWEVLKNQKEVKAQIPAEILEHIHKKADNFEYKIVYQEGKDIMEIISEEAFCMYLSLYLQYVADEKEKGVIKKLLIDNEIAYKNSKFSI